MYKSEIILPIILLILAFLFKLLIDRTTTLPLFLKALYELPVDIAFLATSFIIAYIISSPTNAEDGLFRILVYLIGTIMITFFWRRSINCFEKDHYLWSGILAVVGFAFSIYGLVSSIQLLVS